MNVILANWNDAGTESALQSMTACCGAKRWAAAMIAHRPVFNEFELYDFANRAWSEMEESDWLEAFACHPRIGERMVPNLTSQSTRWSSQEQSSIDSAAKSVITQLAERNTQYENRFGFTYIVCATGKSPEEMLEILLKRLQSDRASELREAAEQQRQIMQLRLRKWLEQ